MALADQDVVWLDVRVDDLVLVHVGQTNQELLRVSAHRLQRHAFVFRVLLEGCSQVVPHALENQAEVLAVVEGRNQPDDVLLVVLIRAVQPFKDLDLLLGRLCHHVVVAHDLDGNQTLLAVLLVFGLYDIGEDSSAASGLDDEVAAAHNLAYLRDVIPLLIVPVQARRTCEANVCRLPQALFELVVCLLPLVEHVAAGLLLPPPALQQEPADLLPSRALHVVCLARLPSGWGAGGSAALNTLASPSAGGFATSCNAALAILLLLRLATLDGGTALGILLRNWLHLSSCRSNNL
mmetsp:Transcript_16998/g.53605  ORF Transcript_16998/g.53605 Transcript_16998/m.53605 type:complete len:293 (-) Transcript_16998:560-1438(-)